MHLLMKIKYIIPILLQLMVYSFVYSQNGIIKGTVLNAINNEPIAFVSVAVQGTTYASLTDEKGNYEIKNLSTGEYNLTASYVGFETMTTFEIQVMNSKPSTVDFLMKEKTSNLKQLEVKASPFSKNTESPVSVRTIGVSEIARNPGGNKDISKVIQSLPGVAPTSNYRNDIIIRGGAPNENRFYLDGIEIPNLNHFATQGSSGGPVGMINVDFIREVDFYSSAFPANRNNALSSVMEFRFKEGRSDRIGGNFAIGASDIALTMEGPLNKNATFLASARRSYLQFLFKALGLPFLPTYNDFQVKYHWNINTKNEITFIGLGAIDNSTLNTSLQENGTQQQKYILGYLPTYNQWNYANGLKYVHFSRNGYITMVASRNMLNNESHKYQDNVETPDNKILDYKSQEIENKFRIEETARINEFKLNYGVNYEYAEYNSNTFNRISTPNGIDTLSFYSQFDMNKWGIFAQISKPFLAERLNLSFGFRTDANDFDKSMQNPINQLSPRFSLSYSITPELSFNANTGIYYQLPPYTVLGYRDNSGALINKQNEVTYIKSIHYVAGFEYLTSKNLKFTAEGFLKQYSQYPFVLRDSISLANLGSDFGVIGNDAVVSTSTGRSYGFEFLAQQKLLKGFYGLATYTFVRSEFRDKHNSWVPSSWDNVHIINLTAGKTFKKNWEVGIKWKFSLGNPYTPYNQALSSNIINWNITHQGIPDYNKLNSERLPSYHQLDLRIDKKISLKKTDLNFYIDLQNVYVSKMVMPSILDVVRDQNNAILIDPSDPTKYQTILLENKSGTIVPTVGIEISF
jgi:hypothetical protein